MLHSAPPLPHVITTERLVLRPTRATDAAAIFRIFSDPRVTQYWFEPPMSEMAQAEARVENLNRPDAAQYALAFRETDEFIGTISVFAYVSSCRRAELGYALDADHWGKGLMFEAASSIVNHCFRNADLNRLEADIDPRNTASERLLRRLGFKEEGYMSERWIVNGVVSDTRFFGLLKSKWPGAATCQGAEHAW